MIADGFDGPEDVGIVWGSGRGDGNAWSAVGDDCDDVYSNVHQQAILCRSPAPGT